MNSAAPMLTELGPKFSLPMCQYRLHATAPVFDKQSQFIKEGLLRCQHHK